MLIIYLRYLRLALTSVEMTLCVYVCSCICIDVYVGVCALSLCLHCFPVFCTVYSGVCISVWIDVVIGIRNDVLSSVDPDENYFGNHLDALDLSARFNYYTIDGFNSFYTDVRRAGL